MMIAKKSQTAFATGGIIAVVLCSPQNALAILNTQLAVTYTDLSIEGPLSFGLDELPQEVIANFLLSPGQLVPDPDPENDRFIVLYEFDNVLDAIVSFGDGTWTNSELNSFEFAINNLGVVETLNYAFDEITTSTAAMGIVLNFPLTITGVDAETDSAFRYTYSESSQSVTEIPAPAGWPFMALGLMCVSFICHRLNDQHDHS